MFHGTADDFPSNILWTNSILERQGWILWENARLLKDDTRPCRFGCYAWWRFSWGQGSYNTSGECWEVEGPSLWDSVRSVRVSGFAVNESHKFTLGPALGASTFRRIPLKEESNLWRKAIYPPSGCAWKHARFTLISIQYASIARGTMCGSRPSGSFWKILVECRREYISMRCWLRLILGAYILLMAVVLKRQVFSLFASKLFPAWSNGFQKIEADDEHHLQPQFRQPDPK